MSEFSIRTVTLEDYERVLDINKNVYDGKDYMHYIYPHFFHLNNCRIYALEQDSLLVSFVIFMLSQDGTVVKTMAVRVRPTHQGLGLSVDKNPMLRERLKTDEPSVRRELYATVRHDGSVKKIDKSLMHYEWNVIGKRIYVNKEIPAAILDIKYPDVVSLSYSDILRSLETNDKIPSFLSRYAKDYLPAEVYWLPTRIEFNELRRMFAVTNALVTFSESNNNNEVQPSLLKSDIKALSYRSFCPVPIGCKADVYYYGALEDIRDHVMEHLKHVAKMFDDLVVLHVHVPLSIDLKQVIEKFQDTKLFDEGALSNSERMPCVLCSKQF